MSNCLRSEEVFLLKLLRLVLKNESNTNSIPEELDWIKLFALAEKHAVLPLLYDVLQDYGIPEYLSEHLNNVSFRTVQQSYRLAFLSKSLVDLFDENGIFCIILKGVCASEYYPVPELRKSGDIDLMIDPEKLEEAAQILEQNGFVKSEEQHANYHVAYCSAEGIEVELHTMLTEPLDNNEVNKYLDSLIFECKSHCKIRDVMGLSVKTLDDGYFAYQLLLHMLHHFLRAGFGLKLLCDWVIFWNKSISNQSKEDFLRLVSRSKLKGFSDVITAVCVYELGLEEKNVSFMFQKQEMPNRKISAEFINEIIEAEEFGNSSKERMVIMRGTDFSDYAREFHHQMRLNFPKIGKIFIIWPVTWFITLIRFLVNNRKIRRTSTRSILEKAHSRSKLMNNINIFKE